jgi:hypothetical protein
MTVPHHVGESAEEQTYFDRLGKKPTPERDYNKQPPTLEERIRWDREEGNACTDTLLMVARLDDLDERVKKLERKEGDA